MKLLMLTMLIALGFSVHAQQLAPDQNPRYMESQQKYMGYKDSLQSTMNTTVDQTYKAYDWYEAKMERKQERREQRYQRKLNRSYYSNYNYGYYGYNPYNNYNSYYGFQSWLPHVGYRSGNWGFWF